VRHRGPYSGAGSVPFRYPDVVRVERGNLTTDLREALEEAVPELQRLERRWLDRGTPLYALDLRRHRQLAEKLLMVLRQRSVGP